MEEEVHYGQELLLIPVTIGLTSGTVSLMTQIEELRTGDCSDKALVGQSIGVTDNCYTSQLHVRVAADMNNETINCDHRPGTEINNIGQSPLVVMTGI